MSDEDLWTAVEEFSYLWNGGEKGWVLWRLPATGEDELGRLTIFNSHTRQSLVIEIDAVHSGVVERMESEGVGIIAEYQG